MDFYFAMHLRELQQNVITQTQAFTISTMV